MHDLLGLVFVVDLESEEVLWSSQLEFGGVALPVLLDGDSVGLWEMLLLSSHDLNEFLQVLDFLWLYKETNKNEHETPLIVVPTILLLLIYINT